MSTYLAPTLIILTTVAAVAAVYLVGRWTAVDRRPIGALPFHSGWSPQEHALSRYHIRWYPITLTFLVFDVEMLFMYPWAVIVASMGTEAVVEMFLFLGLLMVAVLWAWREGAFRWV